MKFAALTALLALLPALTIGKSHPEPLKANQIKTFVTFGDSTTDTGRVLNGGVQWPDYVSGYTGVKLYPNAVSGSTCSNALTPRPFNDLVESQVPKFLEQKANGTMTVDPMTTLYTLWMGTNDVGVNSIITQGNEATVVEVAECLVGWVKTMYDSGARYFLFENLFPLEKAPIYSLNSWYGFYWHLERNATYFNYMIRNLVDSLNTVTRSMLVDLAPTLPGAHIALFDIHGLFNDIHANPGNYLNGTAPLNITGAVKVCIYEVGTEINECTFYANGTDRDSFLWYDELHVTEQADRNIARQVANVIQGKGSPWITWLS